MPLTRDQGRGIKDYQLTEAQVTYKNFAFYTLEAIDLLRKRDKDMPIAAAYEQVKDYSSTQVFALKLNDYVEQLRAAPPQSHADKVASIPRSSGYQR